MLRYRKLLGIDVEALGFDVFTSLGCLGNGPQTACNHSLPYLESTTSSLLPFACNLDVETVL